MSNIVDVDFRYVMRPDRVRAAQVSNPPMVKVLQWRKQIIDPRWKHPEPEWTDWQDVKTETEE